MKKTFLILFILILTIMSINSRSKTIPEDSHYFGQENCEGKIQLFDTSPNVGIENQ